MQRPLHPNDAPGVFFIEDAAWVEFDETPGRVELTIDGETGTQTLDGVRTWLQPDEPLLPSTEYRLRVSWEPAEASPYVLDFVTSPHGAP